MDIYELNRLKYRPSKVKLLFIAEAPPENPERFFYYEQVNRQDALFVNLIRTLYADCRNADIKEIRSNKGSLLERFRNDGYYLIDALPEPISLKLSPNQREKLIKAKADKTSLQASELNPELGVVLIKATVFKGLYARLAEDGLKVLNDFPIPFPSSGQQKKFRTQLNSVIQKLD